MDGVMFNKDVVHPKMRRRIERPRVLLLDCTLEYKKGESQTNVEVTTEEDWSTLLKMEEEHLERLCADIIVHKVRWPRPHTRAAVRVLTRVPAPAGPGHHREGRGRPGAALPRQGRHLGHPPHPQDGQQPYCPHHGRHHLQPDRRDHGALVPVMRSSAPRSPLRPPLPLLRVSGQEEDIGNKCGLFDIRKIGDEYFTFMEQCDDPKACSIVLRGASKDVLNEIERNLQDAMQVARNIVFNPRLLPGGGATEMAVSQALLEGAKSVDGVKQWPFAAVGHAMEVIPRTLIQNCGADTVRLITALRVRRRPRAPAAAALAASLGA